MSLGACLPPYAELGPQNQASGGSTRLSGAYAKLMLAEVYRSLSTFPLDCCFHRPMSEFRTIRECRDRMMSERTCLGQTEPWREKRNIIALCKSARYVVETPQDSMQVCSAFTARTTLLCVRQGKRFVEEAKVREQVDPDMASFSECPFLETRPPWCTGQLFLARA